MINSTELRLGNLVLVNSKTVGRVTRIYEDRAQVEYTAISETTGRPYIKRSYIDCQWLEGIPLTPEWLERMGFVADGVEGIYMSYSRNGVKIWHDVHKNTFLVDNIKTLKVAPKLVHELQNVMFALSGRELEIK